jgi:hypothetical protein
MRHLTFNLSTPTLQERPLRDLDRERCVFAAAVIIEGAQDYGLRHFPARDAAKPTVLSH